MISRLTVSYAAAVSFLCAAGVSKADVFTMFGAGAKSISYANGGTAVNDDYSSIFGCPAAISFGVQSIGASFIVGVNQLGINLSPRPSGYDPGDIGSGNPVIPYKYRLKQRADPPQPPDIYGFEVGTTLTPFVDWLTLGILAYIPVSGLGRQYTYFADEREQYFSNTLHYELYGEQLISQQILIGASALPLKWFSAGLGLRMLPSSDTNTLVLIPNPVYQTYQEMNLRVETSLNLGVMAGLMFSIFDDQFRFAATFRDKIEMNVSGKTTVQIKGFETSDEYPFYQPLDFTILCLPRQFVWAAAYKNDFFNVAADLTFSQWSNYKDNHGNDAGFSDTYSFSIGGELKATDWLKIRSGFGYRPSPVPAQSERTNYVDNDMYLLGIGAVFDLNIEGKSLELNLFTQMQFARGRNEVKNSAAHYPACAEGVERLCDEIPDDIKDIRSGKPLKGVAGLQTGNPGWPGFSSGGWIGLTGIQLVWRYR